MTVGVVLILVRDCDRCGICDMAGCDICDLISVTWLTVTDLPVEAVGVGRRGPAVTRQAG